MLLRDGINNVATHGLKLWEFLRRSVFQLLFVVSDYFKDRCNRGVWNWKPSGSFTGVNVRDDNVALLQFNARSVAIPYAGNPLGRKSELGEYAPFIEGLYSQEIACKETAELIRLRFGIEENQPVFARAFGVCGQSCSLLRSIYCNQFNRFRMNVGMFIGGLCRRGWRVYGLAAGSGKDERDESHGLILNRIRHREHFGHVWQGAKAPEVL